MEASGGELATHSVGDLAPGATLSSHLGGHVDSTHDVRLVWRCQDSKGRVRVWSYNGRSKRLRGDKAAMPEAAFRAMYP